MRQRSTSSVILGIALAGLAVRLLFLYLAGWENRLYDELWDEQIYWDMGRNLLQGKGFAVSFGRFNASPGPTSIEVPGYPLFLASLMAVFGESMWAVRVVQAGLGALSCVFVYKATQRLAGDRTAAWAGALMALYPPFVMYTRVLQAEMLFVALFTAAVWVTLEFLAAPTVWRSALMGLLWVTSLLTRPDGSIFAVVAGLYVLAALTVRHGRAVVRVLPALAPAVAIVTLLWGSWIVRNYQLHGVLMPMVSTTGTGLWSANYLRYQRAHNPDRYPAGVLPELIDVPGYPAMSEVERDAALGRLGSQFIREHPATFAYYGLTRLNVIFPLLPRRAEFQPVEADGPYVTNNPTALVEFPLYNTPLERLRVWTFRLLFVCAVAACVGAWRRRDVRLVLAMLMILTLPARMVAYQGGERARLMIDPFIIVLAAGFLAERSARRETAAQPTLVQAPAQQG